MQTRSRVSKSYPKDTPGLLVFAQNVYAQASTSKYLKSITGIVTVLGTNVKTSETAHQTALTRVVGAVAARNTTIYTLKLSLDDVANGVQTVANSDPANAEEIILSSGFKLAQSTRHGRQEFRIDPGENPGEIIILLPVFDADSTYFVQYTIDQKVYVDVPESHIAKVIVKGLPLHTTIWLRHRASSRKGSRDWSALIEHFVTK